MKRDKAKKGEEGGRGRGRGRKREGSGRGRERVEEERWRGGEMGRGEEIRCCKRLARDIIPNR